MEEEFVVGEFGTFGHDEAYIGCVDREHVLCDCLNGICDKCEEEGEYV